MAPYRKQIHRIESALSFKWVVQWITVVLLSFTALVVALGAPYLFGHQIVAGEIAQHDYVARKKTIVDDVAKTRQAQEQALANMVPVFQKDEATVRAIVQDLNGKIEQVGRTLKGTDKSGSNKSSATTTTITAEERAVAGTLSAREYPQWQQDVRKATQHYLSVVQIFPGTSTDNLRDNIFQFLPESEPAALRSKTAELIATTLRPDMVIDPKSTHARAEETLRNTQSITKEIENGTRVIRSGDTLSSEDVTMLKQMGIVHTQDIGSLLGIATALLTAFCLFGLFLYTYEAEFFFSPSAIALMATVCVVTSGIASAVGREYPQFVPLPATALVLSVIFGRRTAVLLALLVILFLRVSDLVDGAHLVALASASGIALGMNINKRKELMLTGILIGIVQAAAYFFAVMFGGMPASALGVGRELAENFLGGLSSSIVAIGSLPFLEILFGILTPFRVAELTEPDQPLLRQLEENAPGTYQHSLAVANLAEAGAKAIGADVNLVRAGAMYHDIGKMVTPRFFIENQLGDKNPHDEISPEESRAKVLAHVTNGLDLARKYGLPKQVQDFIPEHQGTTIMAYFYHKACVRDGTDNVAELDYRYPGPKPQTKETCIVMLADVSEAVTHSMKDPTQEEVETVMGNVFKARWDDGQFNESDLTPTELEKVKQAFVRVWRTLHHERLKYPSTTTGKMPVPPPREPSPSSTQPGS